MMTFRRSLLALALLTSAAHAQQLSSLPPATTPLTGAELLYIVQQGISKQIPVLNAQPQNATFLSLVVGSPSGGNKGAGSINAQSIYVNGVAVSTGGNGTVTNIATTAPITGGPITATGTIGCSTAGSGSAGCVTPDGTATHFLSGAGTWVAPTGTGGTVTTTGSPTAGDLVTFSGPTSITSLAATGTGLGVRATSPSVSGLTVTSSFTATGLVTNADLVNSSMTIGGQSISLGGTTTNQGNGGKIQLSTGTTTTNNCVKFDANGNVVDAGAACGSGSGTVTAVSVASANGFAGSSSGGATPALTLSTSITGLLKGNGTAISAASAGTDYLTPTGNGSGLTGLAYTQLPSLSANQVLGALTATTPSGLTVPGCTDTGGNHLNYTSGTGFSCGTSGGATSLTVGSTTVGSGTNTFVLTDNSGVLGNISPSITVNGTSCTLGGSCSPSGASGITALTGDGTATGPGSVAFTLATVNSNVGTFQGITLNAKGLATAATAMSGDATMSGGVITVAKVNGDANVAFLDVAQSWTKPQRTNTISPTISTATFTPVFSTSQNYRIALSSACPCTLANPAAIVAGQSGMFEIVQDGTGSRTITTYGSEYEYAGGTATITLSTAASAVDYIPYYVDSTGSFIVLGGIIKGPTH